MIGSTGLHSCDDGLAGLWLGYTALAMNLVALYQKARYDTHRRVLPQRLDGLILLPSRLRLDSIDIQWVLRALLNVNFLKTRFLLASQSRTWTQNNENRGRYSDLDGFP